MVNHEPDYLGRSILSPCERSRCSLDDVAFNAHPRPCRDSGARDRPVRPKTQPPQLAWLGPVHAKPITRTNVAGIGHGSVVRRGMVSSSKNGTLRCGDRVPAAETVGVDALTRTWVAACRSLVWRLHQPRTSISKG